MAAFRRGLVLLAIAMVMLSVAFAQVPLPTPAPTDPVLVHDGVQADIFYDSRTDASTHFTGSFRYFTLMPGGLAGTYLYAGFDTMGVNRGAIQTVPNGGVFQHVMWIGNKVELYGDLGVGPAFQPSQTPQTGTSIGTAFMGGGGLNIAVLPNGWKLNVPIKAVQANGTTGLVFGAGFIWGHGDAVQAVAQKRAMKAAKRAAKRTKKAALAVSSAD